MILIMKQANKTGFSSRLGFVMAAAGSAVGLGNIWRFPYLVAKYGGGIFLLVYLVLAVTFGFALMTTEIAIGRKTGKSAILAYKAVNQKFSFLGYIASAVPILIFPYYCVIGGWIVKYMTVYFTGQAHAAAADDYFSNFISGTAQPIVFLAIFLFCTALVVLIGVQKGVEKVSKILMPVLILLSLAMAIYALTLDGAMDGFIYYVKPNFSDFSIKTVVAAMGQLFYSMSLAMGIMITYGSYMGKQDNLEQSVRHVEIFDTLVAFLSGLMIVPAVFAFSNGDHAALKAGPGLMFITLPKLFDSLSGGAIFGAAFFLLVFFAALTSSISLMETIVSVLQDKLKWKRQTICLLVMGVALLMALPSTLGYGIWSEVTIFGYQILDFFDFFSNNLLMPIVALLTAVLIGWVVKPKYVIEEVSLSGTFRARKLFCVMITYIVPVCMVIILLSSFLLDLSFDSHHFAAGWRLSAPVWQHFCKFCRLSTCCHSGTLPARKLYCVMISYIVPVCMVIILLSSFLLDL